MLSMMQSPSSGYPAAKLLDSGSPRNEEEEVKKQNRPSIEDAEKITNIVTAGNDFLALLQETKE